MKNTEFEKTNILSITKDANGNVCVEFNETEVVNFKQFIKKVFDDNDNENSENCIKQVRYPNPMPAMQPPYPNYPPMGMMADKIVAPPSLQPMDTPPMMPMMPPMDMTPPMMPPVTPAMDAQPMDAPKPI